MLPKKNRATTKAVEKIFKEGIFINSPSLTFKYLREKGEKTAISFIAPKSIAKLAVKRNLLRRRGYTALKEHLDDFPIGTIGVFMFKKYQDDVMLLKNEIENICHKIN